MHFTGVILSLCYYFHIYFVWDKFMIMNWLLWLDLTLYIQLSINTIAWVSFQSNFTNLITKICFNIFSHLQVSRIKIYLNLKLVLLIKNVCYIILFKFFWILNVISGFETAYSLAHHGAHVTLACSNMSAARSAERRIKKNLASARVSCFVCDLSSLTSVNNFCQQYLQQQW